MTLIIKISDLTPPQRDMLLKSPVLQGIPVHDAAVVMQDNPSYRAACDLEQFSRRCRRGADSCDCGRETRDTCFNWVIA